MTYTANGKEVLDASNNHFADAIDAEAAGMIADALNAMEAPLIGDPWDELSPPFDGNWSDTDGMHPPITAPPGYETVASHAITRQGDEYACSCGLRWDAHDGEEHPATS